MEVAFRQISEETAKFLLGLVNGLTLQVGAPDFDEALAKLLKAREELMGHSRPTPGGPP
jgi:hypothetical protein